MIQKTVSLKCGAVFFDEDKNYCAKCSMKKPI